MYFLNIKKIADEMKKQGKKEKEISTSLLIINNLNGLLAKTDENGKEIEENGKYCVEDKKSKIKFFFLKKYFDEIPETPIFLQERPKTKKEITKEQKRNQLKLWRKTTGYSAKDFAEFFKIPKSTYYKWEQGENEIPDYTLTLLKIAILYFKL